MAKSRVLTVGLFLIGIGLSIAGCGTQFAQLPAGSMRRQNRTLRLSPTVIQSGNVQQLWWCGGGFNPNDTAQWTDTILYEWINTSTHAHSVPVPVLGETPGAWDNLYTCNPKVVKGSFVNPLGNGATYSYAMYYVALGTEPGTNNFIGVAFSNDGMSWKKYPHPIIAAETQDGYGVGQPAAYNTDQHAAIRLFYEDWSFYLHHVDAISSDGVHFTPVGVLNTNGLDRIQPRLG